MKPVLVISTLLFGLAAAVSAAAQQAGSNRIYRCGNEYTNTVPPDQKGCKLIEGGNVTVVQRPRPSDGVRLASTSSPLAEQLRRDQEQAQRARDAEARVILEAELRRAEARRAELLREYNNGEPEKMGPETRNHQKYLDRVAELKASIERTESDIASLRRELERLP
ncbi:MAG: hypothetical protein ACK4J1_12025 [Hylemonella sp.]